MPKEYTFAPLLNLVSKAHQLKTGKDDYDHLPEVWYETFSNPEGWPGITPLKERIRTHLRPGLGLRRAEADEKEASR